MIATAQASPALPESGSTPRIAIVGRGYSGTAMAIALMQILHRPFHLALIDAAPGLGGGVAYGQARSGELLNARARDLSVLPGVPGDFAVWMAEKLYGVAPGPDEAQAAGDRFAPRASFGDYVRQRFARAALMRRDVSHEMIDRMAVRLVPEGEGYRLGFTTGPDCRADLVFLATGYGAAPGGRGLGVPPFAALPPDQGHVVLVGSGLTMVDVLLRLRRDGSDARVTVISRHGWLPQPHALTAQRPAREVEPGPCLADLWADLRAGLRTASALGRPWQFEVNRLRPQGRAIWAALTLEDRRRFLRHLRSLWDVHRHRLPPDQHRALLAELGGGRTSLRPGRVLSVADGTVRVRWRAGAEEVIAATQVIDCSGHKVDLTAPLLADLLAQGLAVPDDLGLGLAVAPDGAVKGPRPGLFALGPLGLGSLLEITGAPEILAQAAEAAETARVLLPARAARG